MWDRCGSPSRSAGEANERWWRWREEYLPAPSTAPPPASLGAEGGAEWADVGEPDETL